MHKSEQISAELAHVDPEIRRQAVVRASQLSGDVLATLLLPALSDSDWRVRKDAVALLSVRPPSHDALSQLVELLNESVDIERSNALLEILGAYGEKVIPLLGTRISFWDADSRKLIADCLARTGSESALEVLERLVIDADINVQAAAIEAIAFLGAGVRGRATELLIKQLKRDDVYLRLVTLESLARIGASVDWQLLSPLTEQSVLGPSCVSLACRSAQPEASMFLVRSLTNVRGSINRANLRHVEHYLQVNEACFSAFANSLQRYEKETGTAGNIESRLAQLLNDESDNESRSVVLLLLAATRSSRAAEKLVSLLGNDQLATKAERALMAMQDIARPVLIRASLTGDSFERSGAVELLGSLAYGSAKEETLDAMFQAIADGNPRVVRAWLITAAEVGDPRVLVESCRWLRDDVAPITRQAAGSALRIAGARFPELAREIVCNADPLGVEAAAVALLIASGIEPSQDRNESRVSFLARVLSNESPLCRRTALDALAKEESPSALQATEFALGDEVPQVRLAAIRALGLIRGKDGSATGISSLLGLLASSPPESEQIAAIEALGLSGDPAVCVPLMEWLQDTTVRAQVAAVESLSRMPAPGREQGLMVALNSNEGEVLKAALAAVDEHAGDGLKKRVTELMQSESWDVRRAAADASARWDINDSWAILTGALKNEVRPAVRDALRRSLTPREGREAVVVVPKDSQVGSLRELLGQVKEEESGE